MYARISLFRVKEAYGDAEMRRMMQDVLPERLMALPGMLEAYHLGMQEDRRMAIFSVYRSEEALLEATVEIETLWRDFAHVIEGEVEQHEMPVFLHTVAPKRG